MRVDAWMNPDEYERAMRRSIGFLRASFRRASDRWRLQREEQNPSSAVTHRVSYKVVGNLDEWATGVGVVPPEEGRHGLR